MSNKSFRKLPIVTFDNEHCDETCPQLKGFVTKCKLDCQHLKSEHVKLVEYPSLRFDDGQTRRFLRTEECKWSEI